MNTEYDQFNQILWVCLDWKIEDQWGRGVGGTELVVQHSHSSSNNRIMLSSAVPAASWEPSF